MLTRCLFVLALIVAYAQPSAAQTAVTPQSRILAEFDPGRMRQGTTTIVRPEANVVFELRVNGGEPIAAVKAGACASIQPAPRLSCPLAFPPLAEGEHRIEVRALVAPPEPGVSPSAFSAPLSVAMILVTGPSTPVVRVGTLP